MKPRHPNQLCSIHHHDRPTPLDSDRLGDMPRPGVPQHDQSVEFNLYEGTAHHQECRCRHCLTSVQLDSK